MPLPQSDLTGPLHRAFADHLSTGQFHDFIIYCKDGSGFKVHRNVLAAYSDFFKAAIGSDFVVSHSKIIVQSLTSYKRASIRP